MITTDLDLSPKEIVDLASPDAISAFLAELGYSTKVRRPLTPEAIGLGGEAAAAFKNIELLSEDDEGFLRVVFAQPRSLTAKARNDLVRAFRKTNCDHLLILTADFATLEFVLLDKKKKEKQGSARREGIEVVPKIITVERRKPSHLELRALRRFTWTCKDALDQFDKLRGVFDAAHYTGEYFQNRGLFADYFLRVRLREDAAWQDDPTAIFSFVRSLYKDAKQRWNGKEKKDIRDELFKPLFDHLDFKAVVNRPSRNKQTQPDYLLKDAAGRVVTAAFVYPWDRDLDGADQNDSDTPDENPGACVVTALDQGLADWIVVTNGRLWRLYGKHAHSRSTNFYEVDVPEAVSASGETDPNEAFRYFWLFFRRQAFDPLANGEVKGCWLDAIFNGCRDYAKRLSDRLKDRVFYTIFPHLARGFLEDRKHRKGVKTEPTKAELDGVFEATLTLLYRLLFLLNAESRDLLPIHEAAYQAASLKRIKGEIAEKAGVAQANVAEYLEKAYSPTQTALYDRLTELCRALANGDALLNVPIYNGGLFILSPDDTDRRGQRIARFLRDHKVPDRYLALAIDRLARDQDEKTLGLVFIDYKSLDVRHLGSIYEGLLEFKLEVAEEDLTTQADKASERYIALSQAKVKRGRQTAAVVRKGEVYLSNDKAERKASGSYYTPDPIVEYIVANTVGAVLDRKLEVLRSEFRKVRHTFERERQKSEAYPSAEVRKGEMDHRQWAANKTYLAHKDVVERFFDLKVLDPAMGSGHFLVEAVDFITDRLLKFLNEFPINPVNLALERTRASILQSLQEQDVTVDPAKLTEINLLKRHVLKRCIYGVDINPMAVELAKVSLWLYAFTLGAPLNFLDHHLRCGNSLVGATFSDLETATRTLFAIKYEPLLRAINHVLFVSKMADATAAEVSKSATEFAQARLFLSGYQVIFDCVLAQHFSVPQAIGHIIEGHDLDLSSRERFLASLTDESDRQLIGRVEALAQRPDRRFFHWEIEFPEVFFGFVDLDQRHLKHKNKIQSGSAGFDVVVGNPPYDVLAEKELEADLADILAYFRQEDVFASACGGKVNIYKLFICRGVHVLSKGGRLGHIVPMALLGDEQAVGVRKLLLNHTTLVAIEAFPQKDDPRNRVFEDAKLSTCVFVTANTTDDLQFRSRVHPGKSIQENSPSLLMRRNAVRLYDPANQPIMACSQADWDLAVKIMSSGRVKRLGEFSTAYQGEVNEKTDGDKGNISDSPDDGPLILRGANICLYALRDASQGEPIHLRQEKFLQGKKPNAKAWHFRQHRAGFQRNSPQNNFRRLISCFIPAGHFCCDTVSYFPEGESKLALPVLIALFNSKLLDWFFRLGSTNSKVNDYQVQIFPVPAFQITPGKSPEPPGFSQLLVDARVDEAFRLVAPLMVMPPFPANMMTCMVRLVETITKIETDRGEIVRSDRSALDPKAKPYQNLLDRMLFRMAGLSDEEAAGLEDRLATML